MVENHEHNSLPPARVIVDGTEIPVINDGVRTELRKDGPMGITRFSEVYFPREWNNSNYAEAVQALDPEKTNVYDPVDIQFRDYTNGEYHTVHRGFVMGVGGGARGDIERRMTVGDPGQLLSGMPINTHYDADTTFEDIFSDIKDRMKSGGVIPTVFDDVHIKQSTESAPDSDSLGLQSLFQTSEEALPDGLAIYSLGITALSVLGDFLTSDTKEFTENKHTAADVLSWLDERLDGKFYFRPTEGTQTEIDLVYDPDPGLSFSARHLDQSAGTDVTVYKNNALYEIQPVNQFTVIGSTDVTYDYGTGSTAASTTSDYPVARAVHKRLFEASQATLEPPREHADSVTELAEAEQKARKGLRNELDTSSLGTIEMAPAPIVTPFSRVTSRPACGANRSESVPPLEYEVESVVHQAQATDDNNERYHATTVQCSIPTDPEEDIVTISERVQTDRDYGSKSQDLANASHEYVAQQLTDV